MSTTQKFLCLVRFPASTWPAKPASPEEMQAQYMAWKAWMAKFEKELIPGDGLKPGGGVIRGGNVTDGPYIEAKEVLASYTLVQTASLSQAIEIMKASPIGMDPNASIEVRELGGYSG